MCLLVPRPWSLNFGSRQPSSDFDARLLFFILLHGHCLDVYFSSLKCLLTSLNRLSSVDLQILFGFTKNKEDRVMTYLLPLERPMRVRVSLYRLSLDKISIFETVFRHTLNMPWPSTLWSLHHWTNAPGQFGFRRTYVVSHTESVLLPHAQFRYKLWVTCAHIYLARLPSLWWWLSIPLQAVNWQDRAQRRI